MLTATRTPRRAGSPAAPAPAYVYHDSFEEAGAEQLYGGAPAADDCDALGYLPDEATRDCAKRMHYAAWRAARARTEREAGRWRRRYYECRDRVVLGNRKLTFRAVQKWRPAAPFAEDLAAECQVVLIKAVAAYNPWLGVRFSTYAFTCLTRALSRASQRQAADRLSRALPLEALPSGEPCYAGDDEPARPGLGALETYLHSGHTLLTEREKSVLLRRYHLHDDGSRTETLEQVGRDMGLSKERVRQLQLSALGKLRDALAPCLPAGRA